MNPPTTLAAATGLALLTDLYQLTMAQGYWKLGRDKQEAVFTLSFRKAPFAGGYAIAAGLGPVVDLLRQFRFASDDTDYLATLTGNDGGPLFEPAFLHALREMEFACDVDGVPEGTAVFAHEPLLRVRGPMLQAQVLETALLNVINFQTLIATKAARVCAAAGDDAVLEFGLRRAQGIDGALAASRAAYLGGCAATSNVLAGKRYGIPVKGTHAHSWVMSFDDELDSFHAYARAMPNNCVFLVDTYDTLAGVAKAIEVGRQLQKQGHRLAGVRLDSGDLAYLSIQARRMLDDAGFADAQVVASNDLDEHLIQDLKRQGATVAVWGVGTRLATAYDQPALGGVYKLGAIRLPDGTWSHRIKLSEQAAKTSVPGMLQVRRFESSQGLIADMIYDQITGPGDERRIIDPKDPTRSKAIPASATHRDLLVPVARGGRIVGPVESLADMRQRARGELAKLHPATRRFLNPHEYPVGLEPRLHALRTSMIEAARARLRATRAASADGV
jgi:nicotinate phosphoribosyltransferase